MAKKGNEFPVSKLTATQWATAEDKSKFGNDLAKFVMGGFIPQHFTHSLYTRLSNCFGHIAHYNLPGFYAEWFADSRKQLAWVKYVLGHTVCGDPKFTFSDVERLFQSWLALYRADVEEVILRNIGKEEETRKAEQARRDALHGKRTQQFKIAAMSENTGDFGHHQFVMLARDGSAYKVCHIQSNGKWEKGQVFDVPLDQNGNPNWFQPEFSIECPERMKNAPPAVVEEVWGKEKVPA